MFTGIITHIGTVTSVVRQGDWQFTIAAPGITDNLKEGASIACSGVCLTAIAFDKESFTVQASQETLSLTTLGSWNEGTRINLERALKVGDELGGHFVSGHVDGLAVIERIEPVVESWKLDCVSPAELSRFIAPKGSVTLDGVSLTVNTAVGDRFSLNIIPHTQSVTTLGSMKAGDRLNLEIDVIARYIARLG